MAFEGMLSISAASVVEDVIKQSGTRLSDIDLASRRAEEAAARRSDAARWLRKTVGVVIGKDLPEQPSEEEFRLGLRNGIILCNAFNKVYPGTIPKVIEAPADSAAVSDGAALTAFQYFENVRNFLVALEEKGLPTFEASDLEKGGKGSRVVDSVLALKSYSECKQMGKDGSMKHGGILKPSSSGKCYFKKNTEAFMNSLVRSQSLNDKAGDGFFWDHNSSDDFSIEPTEMKSSDSLNELVRSILSDKKPEDIPLLVESMLSKVMQEFERRIANQNEMMRSALSDISISNKSVPVMEIESTSTETKVKTAINDTSVSKVPVMEIEPTSTETKVKTAINDTSVSKVPVMEIESTSTEPKVASNKSFPTMAIESSSTETKRKFKEGRTTMIKEEDYKANLIDEESKKQRILKQNLIFDRQRREIEELKHTLHATKAGMEFMKSQHSVEFSNLSKHLQVLSTAASGYHKVLEENRKLYNQIQDLKGNIRVYCRVRPFLPGQLSGASTIGRLDDGSITILTPAKYGKEGRRSFNFNKVFGPSATQEEVFSDTQPLIRSVLDGYNVCIFAYGQTGAGKTFTMSGPKQLNEQSIGVNYRALNDLFHLSEQRKDTFYYEISVQMIEIYNEQVRDLLDTEGLNKRLEIRNSSQNGLNVPDANVVRVASPSDVIELMNLGERNRAVSATAMNDRSSRSHSCLTIHVQGKNMASGTALRGSMHLVDLAGSERVDKSEVKGDRLKEAQHINKSLAALGDVIASLAQKNSHVPYRNSKLTQLLQDSLGGQAKTLMFVHMSPEMDAVGETLSTLKFAERVATIELGAAKLNKENGEVKELKEQIANLKAALARKEGESEPLIRSSMSSPEIFSMESGIPSPDGDVLGILTNDREPIEDVGNLEDRSNSLVRHKKPNFDLQDLLIPAGSPWTDSSRLNPPKGYYTEMDPGDWADKMRDNDPIRDDDSLKDDFFYQRYLPDRSKFESDSDDSEMATSNSSEIDMQYQVSLSKSVPNNAERSKLKKSISKTMKSPDIRNTSYSQIPIPSTRKAANGSTHTPSRTPRPLSASAGDTKRSNVKMGNGK